jgi:hypothetical protein
VWRPGCRRRGIIPCRLRMSHAVERPDDSTVDGASAAVPRASCRPSWDVGAGPPGSRRQSPPPSLSASAQTDASTLPDPPRAPGGSPTTSASSCSTCWPSRRSWPKARSRAAGSR